MMLSPISSHAQPATLPTFHPACRVFNESHLRAEIIRRSLAGLEQAADDLASALFFALNGTTHFPTDNLDSNPT